MSFNQHKKIRREKSKLLNLFTNHIPLAVTKKNLKLKLFIFIKSFLHKCLHNRAQSQYIQNKHTFFYKQHVNLAQPQLCLNILVIEPLSMLKY